MDLPNNIPSNQQPLITNSDFQNNLLNQQQLNQPFISQNNFQTDKPGFNANPQLENIPQPQLNMAPAPQQPIMIPQQPIIGQPVQYIQPVVATNQVNPTMVLVRNPQDFRCTPIVCVCPNCKNTVTTIVTTNFNWLNCLCCFWSGLFFWIIFQIVRNKDISCNDAIHVCPHCQYVIFNYNAC